MVYRITAKMLKEMEACDEAIKEFSARFPKGAILNRKNLGKIGYDQSQYLDMEWLLIETDEYDQLCNKDISSRPRLRAMRRKARKSEHNMPKSYWLEYYKEQDQICIDMIMKSTKIRKWLRSLKSFKGGKNA